MKDKDEGICKNPNCPHGNPETSFQSISKGYSIGCCNSCSQSVPSVREKTEKTNMRKYGTKSPTENKEILKKRGDKFEEKHGVRNPMQVEEIRSRSIETRRPLQGEIQKNRERNNKLKYGVDNVMKLDENKKKLSDLHIMESKDRIINLLNELNLTVLEYTKCSSKCKLKCNNCGNIFYANPNHLFDIRRLNCCKECATEIYGKTQKEISNFCSEFFDTIVENDRTILEGKEIDVLIPQINIGIEYDGFYWHCEENSGKNKSYHLDKTLAAKNKGINLIHIFEDEWLFKKDIVKSILKSKFGVLDSSVFARKCKSVKLDNIEAKNFYNNNHLQGFSPGNHTALIYNNEIVSCITVGVPRFNKKYKSEIIRFCNKKFVSVVGGLSKLISNILSDDNNSIITYSDARYGTGSGYLRCGFNFVTMTNPGYYYVKNLNRESRLKYQKHKLKNLLEVYDPNLSEWENMKLNGFDRIWDCGNYIFEWK